MSNNFNKSSVALDNELRTKKMVFEVAITADAIESLAWTTAADNNAGNSQFGVLIDGSKLTPTDKVFKVEISEQTALASSLSVAKVGSDFKTAEGNIALDITGTGLALDTESPTILLEVTLKEEV
jgi:hypothetical protein